jgi:hypothetical protein
MYSYQQVIMMVLLLLVVPRCVRGVASDHHISEIESTKRDSDIVSAQYMIDMTEEYIRVTTADKLYIVDSMEKYVENIVRSMREFIENTHLNQLHIARIILRARSMLESKDITEEIQYADRLWKNLTMPSRWPQVA